MEKKFARENNRLNVNRNKGKWAFTCGPCGGWEFAQGHAVPEEGYVPRVIVVSLEIVFLAEVLFRHIGAARWKKRLVQIKVHSIFYSSLGLFSVSMQEASGPPKTNSILH